MTSNRTNGAKRLGALAGAALAAASFAAESAGKVEVSGGTAAFNVATTVPAVSVHGKSTALRGRATLRRGGDGLALDEIEAWIPVKSLATGMSIRDEHMRKYIFTTQNGETPDVRFTAQNAACPGAPGAETVCKIAGELSIRGVSRPFEIGLKVRQDSGTGFRAAGDGVVKLSDYGIDPPSQFGVKTANEVKLHLEFRGTGTTAVSMALPGGGR